MRVLALVGLSVLLLAQCKPQPAATPPPPRPDEEARTLIQQGHADEALARLETLPGGPDVWVLQGQAWATKAESAPLPTPPPGAAPGETTVAPEFKPEELKAIELFERAIGSNPQLGRAHAELARLLAPHAVRRFEQQARLQGQRKRRGPSPPLAPAAAAGEPDWSIERVLRAYQAAGVAGEASKADIEAWIGFAEKVERLAEAEAGYQQLIKRDHESAEPLVRYGDFLARRRKENQRAVEQYQQALIWKPDDASVKLRMADIYLDLGYASYERREYMAAQVNYDEARKYAKDPESPQAQRLRTYQALLQEIRQGSGR